MMLVGVGGSADGLKRPMLVHGHGCDLGCRVQAVPAAQRRNEILAGKKNGPTNPNSSVKEKLTPMGCSVKSKGAMQGGTWVMLLVGRYWPQCFQVLSGLNASKSFLVLDLLKWPCIWRPSFSRLAAQIFDVSILPVQLSSTSGGADA